MGRPVVWQSFGLLGSSFSLQGHLCTEIDLPQTTAYISGLSFPHHTPRYGPERRVAEDLSFFKGIRMISSDWQILTCDRLLNIMGHGSISLYHIHVYIYIYISNYMSDKIIYHLGYIGATVRHQLQWCASNSWNSGPQRPSRSADACPSPHVICS